MKVCFAGGVTGGHISPGVALAEKVIQAGGDAIFASVGNETEERMIKRRGLRLIKIGERNPNMAAMALNAPSTLFRARRLLTEFGPDVVVGLGGGASLGAGISAAMMSKPLVLLEQNVTPGRANKMLARWACLVCCQWENTARAFNGRGRYTGSPIRTEIQRAALIDKREARCFFGLHPDVLTLLVMGGSQGATAINRTMMHAAAKLAGRTQVIHLAGDKDAGPLREHYRNCRLEAHVTTFFETMEFAYAAADIAISRAGATSLAELAAAAVPTILVPYPFAKDDHQRANARAAAEQKWAILMEQCEFTPEALTVLLETTLNYSARLTAMKERAQAWSKPDSADQILNLLEAVVERTGAAARYTASAGIV